MEWPDTPPSIPLYKFQLSKLDDIVAKWKTLLPRVIPFYALKAFTHQKMIQKVAELGCHFDCASQGEISLVKKYAPAADIIYANTMRPSDHLSYAVKEGVCLYTFDCYEEALRIFELDNYAKLVMRISVDNPDSGCNFGEKFGVLSDDLPLILKKLHEKGIQIYGLSFHVGSANTNLEIFPKAIKQCYDICQNYLVLRSSSSASTLVSYPIHLLDIGGGFIDDVSHPVICQRINEALSQYFPSRDDLRIIAEPGRLFAEPLMKAELTIIAKRYRAGRICYTVNESIYGIFYCIHDKYKIYSEKDIEIIDSATRKPFLSSDPSFSAREKKLSTIFGQSCDSHDTLAKDIFLPELEINDKIHFLNMGAYGIDICSEFNGFKNGISVFLDENDNIECVENS
jgi:ornithine decarboxylase